jgi:archaellin
MDVGHQKIGRKILDLHDWKARVGHTSPEEITTTQEVVIQIKAEAGAETKIDLCIVYFTRKIQTIGQGTASSSWSPKK